MKLILKWNLSLIILIIFQNIFNYNFLFAVNEIDSLNRIIQTRKSVNDKIDEYSKLIEIYKYDSVLKAIELTNEGIKFAEASTNQLGTAKLYDHAADIYERIIKFDIAFDYHNKSLNIYKKLKDSLLIGDKYLRIGNLYIIQPLKNDEAEKSYLTALDIYTKLDKLDRISKIYVNLSALYKNKDNYKNAIEFAQKGLEINQLLKDKDTEARLLGNIGNSYAQLNQFDKSIFYLSRTGKLAHELKDSIMLIEYYESIGNVYFSKKEYEKAKLNYFEALKIIDLKKFGIGFSVSIYLSISRYYQEISDFENALKFYKIYIQAKEMQFNIDVVTKIEQIKVQSIVDNHENQIKFLEAEQKLKVQELKTNQIITLLIIALLLIVAGILIYVYISNRKYKKLNDMLTKKNIEITEKQDVINKHLEFIEEQNGQLKELNATKDKFFSIIAHDLKNPLGGLKNLTNMFYESYKEIEDTEKFEFVELLKDASNNVFSLAENLLVWSRSQRGLINFEPNDFDLFYVSESTINLLKPYANNKNISLINQIQENTLIFADVNLITTVIRNLLSNSIKFTNTGGRIIINYRNEDGNHLISITDNGIGMSQKIMDKLFRLDVNVTNKGTNNESGTGLGLILCKEFIEKYSGKIWVESEEGKGSIFFFTIKKIRIQDKY